jgi:hypothetical protein
MRYAWMVALVVGAGCGSARHAGPSRTDDVEGFSCNGRRASYLVVGSFVAPEAGIRIECQGASARLTRWTQQADGTRDERAHVLSQGGFDEAWQAFEDAGWRNLDDCGAGAAAGAEQVYTFQVADADAQVSLKCQGKELPFPFDRLVTALDLAASEFN